MVRCRGLGPLAKAWMVDDQNRTTPSELSASEPGLLSGPGRAGGHLRLLPWMRHLVSRSRSERRPRWRTRTPAGLASTPNTGSPRPPRDCCPGARSIERFKREPNFWICTHRRPGSPMSAPRGGDGEGHDLLRRQPEHAMVPKPGCHPIRGRAPREWLRSCDRAGTRGPHLRCRRPPARSGR
jgi:hypothetical protein